MIQFEFIKNFYPAHIRENSGFSKYILKEHILLMILDFLSSTAYVKNLAFIGGTSIRLTKGIDRFSEDLDFDCKNFSDSDFSRLAGDVLLFLRRNGLEVEIKESKKDLKAFRQNLIFPELLYDLGLSGHKEERFLIKLECQDQLFSYDRELYNIKGGGYFFPFPVPPVSVLCSMKINAMFNRNKGRDFYDVMFLLSQASPDYDYLREKLGIENLDQLKQRVRELTERVNMQNKVRDFEHLIFQKSNAGRILLINDFIAGLKE